MAEPDRRAWRTRSAFIDAFLGLVVENGYEKITVQDILDRADIGRSTFYAHCRDEVEWRTSAHDPGTQVVSTPALATTQELNPGQFRLHGRRRMYYYYYLKTFSNRRGLIIASLSDD